MVDGPGLHRNQGRWWRQKGEVQKVRHPFMMAQRIDTKADDQGRGKGELHKRDCRERNEALTAVQRSARGHESPAFRA
jgi:hypothetical protein